MEQIAANKISVYNGTSVENFNLFNYTGQVDDLPSATGVGRYVFTNGLYEGEF